MKTRNILAVILFALLFSNCENELETQQISKQIPITPLTKQQIDERINQIILERNEFKWEMVDDHMLWSAIVRSDSTIIVGYQPSTVSKINGRIHSINIASPSWEATKNEILTNVIADVNTFENISVAKEDVLLLSDNKLPVLDLKVFSFEAISNLRNSSSVRYLEPFNYISSLQQPINGKTNSTLGCGNDPNNAIPTADYRTVAPGAKVPWTFDAMNIPAAWAQSTGSGITVAVIDTGLSPDQAKLNNQFNSGQSQGRYVEKFGTYKTGWWWASIDGPNDKCGHGTQMAGTVAAPRGTGGASLGVAYNANLIGIRGTSDVVVNTGNEKNGVSDAIKLAADRSDVKIISMSIGDVFWNSKIADAIRYAYGKGKLIFCAAGTSTSVTNWVGVVFPARMDETVAVTGIKDNGYNACNTCHYGSKVDFTMVMQRSNDNSRTSLTLAKSGNQPSSVGGSSVATAMTAGIAALVWSKQPGLTRSQVLDKLKNASDNYPGRDGNFGWGNIDAFQAVNN